MILAQLRGVLLLGAPPLRNRAFGRISCVAFRVACVGLPRHVSQKRHILHGISLARGFAGGGGEEASWGGVGS